MLRVKLGHPEQNCVHERLHKTLKAETARPPAASLAAQQWAFQRSQREYNHQHPHEALEMKNPAELYCSSPRPFPKQEPEVEYPGHFEVCRVRPGREITWRGKRIFVSEVFAVELLGLEEVDDGIGSLSFGHSCWDDSMSTTKPSMLRASPSGGGSAVHRPATPQRRRGSSTSPAR